VRFSAAASFFDKVVCTDAYTPTDPTFKAQLDLFDDSKRDGATVVRRVLSVSASVTIPARRAVAAVGETWIVAGHGHPDAFRGETVRVKYVVQQADGLASVQTAEQLLSTGGTSAYVGRVWTKDLKELEVSSKMYGFFTLFLAPTETVSPGQFLTLGGRIYVVRNVYMSAAGLLAAESEELGTDALQAGVSYYARGAGYSPVTDDVTESAAVVLNLVRMRYQVDYAYPTESAPKYLEGDLRALIRKAAVATARADDQVALSEGRWRVVAAEDEHPCWGLHLRRA